MRSNPHNMAMIYLKNINFDHDLISKVKEVKLEVKGQNFPQKSRFGLSFESIKFDVHKSWHSDITWPWEQAYNDIFFIVHKFVLLWWGQRSKFDLISPQNHVFACHSDPASTMWTKLGTTKQLDSAIKLVKAFFNIYQK